MLTLALPPLGATLGRAGEVGDIGRVVGVVLDYRYALADGLFDVAKCLARKELSDFRVL